MKKLNIYRFNADELAQYVGRQLEIFVPDGMSINQDRISIAMPTALERLRICINSIRVWRENEFNYLHSSQYCIFLYYLANTIWRESEDIELSTKLFILNKILNAIDLYYEIEMPSKFFIGHSAGIVLAKAKYSDYLVLYQNSTVGKNHGISPNIDTGVIMYPNTAIIGRCHVRSGTVISQGVSLINCDTPGECIVFDSKIFFRRHFFKEKKRDILADIFR